MNIVGFLGRSFFGRQLEEKGPSLTFARLCTSRHVDDLQAIASVAFFAILVCLALLLRMSFNLAFWKDQMIFVGGIIATATAALSWAYQAGSRRLGAVDLFASEISVICRVCLIVDFAKNCVASVEALAASSSADAPFGKFTSQEHYTPAYDKTISDLQSLDFDVVTNVTRFYTYRMTMMDLLRRLAEPGAPAQRAELMRQMIYMQFLMYESARFAVVQLIEFEPHQSEAVINILCSEIVLYGYLMGAYDKSFQGERLRLRIDQYGTTVAEIERRAAASDDGHWLQAKATMPELRARHDALTQRLGPNPALIIAA